MYVPCRTDAPGATIDRMAEYRPLKEGVKQTVAQDRISSHWLRGFVILNRMSIDHGREP